MIYLTGDTHGDFMRFSTSRFPEQKEMAREDRVIILGDFGGVWCDDKEERYALNWLNAKPFTTLFVDGNHENFDRLYSDEFEIIPYCGGWAHKIRDNVLHLMRGNVFEFEGKSFFCFGGAASHDIEDGVLDPASFPSHRMFLRAYNRYLEEMRSFRVKGYSWWPQEIPSDEEMFYGKSSLGKRGYHVDYVLTHCLPQTVASSAGFFQPDAATIYFDTLLSEGLAFSRWFCGHYHTEQLIFGQYEILYHSICRLL